MMKDEQIGKILRKAFESNLGDSELKMLLAIALSTNDRGFCAVSNEQFAKRLKTSTRSITGWVATLKNQKVINIVQNNHRHERWIYINGMNFAKYKSPEDEELSAAQKLFHEAFPNREIDCDVPDTVDMNKLIFNMRRSRFLRNADNMSLYSCCVKHYKQIMSGWKDAEDMPFKGNFSTGRNYTREEMNSLFQSVDEIVI